jgi:hypothetical protein
MARRPARGGGAHNYLTPRALRGLKAYTYKATGYTWLDDLHTPFWNGERVGGRGEGGGQAPTESPCFL